MDKEADLADWLSKFDALKLKLELKADVQAAEIIGLSKQMINHVRHRRCPMPPIARFRLLEQLEPSMSRDQVMQHALMALPKDMAFTVRQALNKHGQT